MNSILSHSIVAAALLALPVFASAAPSKKSARLTPARLAELTPSTSDSAPKSLTIEISGISAPTGKFWEPVSKKLSKIPPTKISLNANRPEGLFEFIRELRFPSAFTPPRATGNARSPITPMTPTAFETVNTGWTIRLAVKSEGKWVSVKGVAEYVESEFVPGGYGPLAQPIRAENGDLLSPNFLNQPRLETTSTRFHIFAIPGEPYDVVLYRGKKAEKCTITVRGE